MAADDAPVSCPTCGGQLIGGSRFCGRCGTPQTMSAKHASVQPPPADAWGAHTSSPNPYPNPNPNPNPNPYPNPYPNPNPNPNPYPYANPYPNPSTYPDGYLDQRASAIPRADRRGWKTAVAIVAVVLIVGGAAVAGVIVASRGGGHTSFLACPGGICPRFAIDRLTRLQIDDPVLGRVRLAIPPGALREPTELTVRPAPADSRPPSIADPWNPAPPTVLGPIVRLGPDGQTFDQPVRLELPLDVAKVPPGAQVAAVTWDGARAERLAPVAYDAEAGTVAVEVRHFSDVVAIVDPGANATFVAGAQPVTPPPPPPPLTPPQPPVPPPPELPPCPPFEAVQEKCPWTPDGYSIGACPPGFCWDGGPQGFLACKQKDAPPGTARGENLVPYCPSGVPIYDRCSGLLTGCAPPTPLPP